MIASPGPWPWRLPPIAGESLTSCLIRNARAHGDGAWTFMASAWPGDPVWERDFDADPTSLGRGGAEATCWLDDLAASLGVPRQAVSDATMAEWRHRLRAGIGGGAGDTPLVLSAGILGRSRMRHAWQFCPDCLAEGVAHFRKAWRLAFVVACDRHGGRPLMDACGCCGTAVAPHLSEACGLRDCHACQRPLADRAGRTPGTVPRGSLSLQRRLSAALESVDVSMAGELAPGEVLGTVRVMIAASAPVRAHARLREALGLVPDHADGGDRRRFEHCRRAVRAPWLETVAAWLDDWPANFLAGAEAIGASQRTFARCRPPPSLAAQVKRLPVRRHKARKPWEPLLDEPALRKLRRLDRPAYHAERARRILQVIEPP